MICSVVVRSNSCWYAKTDVPQIWSESKSVGVHDGLLKNEAKRLMKAESAKTEALRRARDVSEHTIAFATSLLRAE
jgi:fatty acid-binding protein DegV